MNTILKLAIAASVVLLTSCAIVPASDYYGYGSDADISDYASTGKQMAQAANNVLPEVNDINTCPELKPRIDHDASGGASSNIKVTERGTKFKHAAHSLQSHDCQ